MDSSDHIKKILAQFQEGKGLEQVESFREPETWESFAPPEKRILAKAFADYACCRLLDGSEESLEWFQRSEELQPDDLELLEIQGKAWLTHGRRHGLGKCLSLALQTYQKCARIQEDSPRALYHLALTLLALGQFHEDGVFFQDAEEKFADAERYKENAAVGSRGIYWASFYWDWARCLSYVGKGSGEALDFHRAVEKFEMAREKGCTEPLFWNEYANTLVELGCLLGQRDRLDQALSFYQKACKRQDFFEAWLNQACTLKRIYEMLGGEEEFHQAHQCFLRASEMRENFSTLWFQWGVLLCQSGKRVEDVKRLELGLEKLEKAQELEPQRAPFLLAQAEALVELGRLQESFEYLSKAREKVSETLAWEDDSAAVWHCLGVCYLELARYFQDDDYATKAIEAFKEGLDRDGEYPLLWHGLAHAYLFIAELLEEVDCLSMASDFFWQAVTLAPEVPELWNDWGEALLRAAEMKEDSALAASALEKMEEALARWEDPGPVGYFNYALALGLKGDLDGDEELLSQAVDALKKAQALDPEMPELRFQLALAQIRLAESEGDREGFEEALQTFQSLALEDKEDDRLWYEWGVSLLSYAEILRDFGRETGDILGEAEAKLCHAAAMGYLPSYYYLACVNSLQGEEAAALHFLERASQAESLPPVEQIAEEPWLEELGSTAEFRQFIAAQRLKQQPQAE